MPKASILPMPPAHASSRS